MHLLDDIGDRLLNIGKNKKSKFNSLTNVCRLHQNEVPDLRRASPFAQLRQFRLYPQLKPAQVR